MSGEFGVLLAQRVVDELIYGQDGNKVLLIKYLNSAARSLPNPALAWASMPAEVS